jgi:hypothetical protein
MLVSLQLTSSDLTAINVNIMCKSDNSNIRQNIQTAGNTLNNQLSI